MHLNQSHKFRVSCTTKLCEALNIQTTRKGLQVAQEHLSTRKTKEFHRKSLSGWAYQTSEHSQFRSTRRAAPETLDGGEAAACEDYLPFLMSRQEKKEKKVRGLL